MLPPERYADADSLLCKVMSWSFWCPSGLRTILAPLAVELDEMPMPHVKTRQNPEILRSDKYLGRWSDSQARLKTYGALRAARAPDRRTQTAASGGAIPLCARDI